MRFEIAEAYPFCSLLMVHGVAGTNSLMQQYPSEAMEEAQDLAGAAASVLEPTC